MRKFFAPRPIYVTCSECNEQFDEDTVEFKGIEEDFFGRDVLTFKCPKCEKIVKSLRRG